MKWRKPPVDAEAVKALARRYDLDLLTAAILVRRGVTDPAKLPYWLEDDLRYLHDPFLFEDMPELVERVLLARDEGEIVLVFGDRDADGITSTAVMVDTLREIGIDAEWRVPEGDDEYGLTMEVVEQFAARDGTLIITVDCGITSIDEITRAQDLGIDTIIVDHHNPPEALPPAVAIVDPKVGDTYPFDGLCTCALAAKVRQALALGQTELFEQAVTLLNARPLNDTVLVEAVSLEYGLETDRVSEALVPGVARLESSRLESFLVNRTLVCYDAPLQQRLLQQGLGRGVDIHLLDLAEQVRELFPGLAGKSLLEMREGSRLARYAVDTAEEIDVLVALYQAVVNERFPGIREALLSVLDLTAIATVADMMPIVDENRSLVRAGLQRLNSTPGPGIAALLRELDLTGRTLVSRDIGWMVSPVINASGRMGTPSRAVRLLLTADPEERSRLAAEIHEQNKKRRQVGEEGWRRILPRAEALIREGESRMIALHDPEVHRGVTGIIAGRLTRRYGVPAAVITSIGDDNLVGSIRSTRGFMATLFLEKFSDILDKWGGHNEAAGFNLPRNRIDAFWKRFQDVVSEVDLEAVQDAEIEIDAELPPKYLTPELEALVQRFEPYGQKNPALRFLAKNMVLQEMDVIGRDQTHLRLLLAGGGYKWPAVYWSAADRANRDLRTGDRVDVIFEFTRNHYNGNSSIQLVIVDAQRSDEQIGPEESRLS